MASACMDDAVVVTVVTVVRSAHPWPSDTAHTMTQAVYIGQEGTGMGAQIGPGARSSLWHHGITLHVAGP